MKIYVDCPACRQGTPMADAFCVHCGARIDSHAGERQPHLQQPRGGYPHADSLRQMESLRSRKRRRAAVASALFLAAGLLVLLLPNTNEMLVFILAFIGLTVYYWMSQIRASEYYSLPHARDEEGEHRCIYCGGRGIWRKGEYGSSATYNNCSRCRRPLFVDLF